MRKLLLTVLTLFLIAAPLSARAQNVLFIVDFSGSMNQKVGDRPKIDVAKDVFRNVVNDMPSSAKLGLMLYGHRRAKDCRDIELVSGLGQRPAPALAEQVAALPAKGETPIATALLQSLGAFANHKGEQNSVVLITDGREECEGDPCAAAEALASAGLDVKINVVGFRLNEEQRKSIECISRVSGGRYYDAQNAGALRSALADVRQAVTQAPPPVVIAQAPPPVVVAPAPPPAPKRTNLLAASEGGELIAAPGVLWTQLTDGKEDRASWFRDGEEGVYQFKDGRAATFDTFATFIAGTDAGNVKELELFAADSAAGPFRSIGRFSPQNLRMMRSPFQEFKFDPVTATHVKVKLISSQKGDTYIAAHELALYGELGDAPPAARAQTQARPKVSLIAASEGGELIAAPSQLWAQLTDGKEERASWFRNGEEGIYQFKDGRPATLDTFTVFIGGTDSGNLKEFELLAADSASGPFRSIGRFSPQNVRMMKQPHQEFTFEPVTATHLKVKLLSSQKGDSYIAAHEFRLYGQFASREATAQTTTVAVAKPRKNIFANGGELIAAPGQLWAQLTDGKEARASWFRDGEEGIYELKGGRPATFDTFAMFIGGTDSGNVKEFELLAADAAGGPYRSIGRFSPQNLRLMKSPYQEFSFAPVTASHLKVKLLSSVKGDSYILAHEFQLFGE